MQEQDIAAVAAMEQMIFSSPWSEKSFRDALQSEENIYLVAEEEQIAGYCGIWISYETADLCNMAVMPEYRRRQIGEALLLEGINRAAKRQVQSLLLEVRQSNQAAIGLYEKIGFQKIGIRKNYYRLPQEDAVLMQYAIKHSCVKCGS
jgi:ribosomal-protein-alanine N-acetyltransferase